MHRLREAGVFDSLEFLTHKFPVSWGQADRWPVCRISEGFNRKGFDVFFTRDIVKYDCDRFNTVVQDLEVVRLVFCAQCRVNNSRVEFDDLL